jgi:hypothetical protein
MKKVLDPNPKLWCNGNFNNLNLSGAISGGSLTSPVLTSPVTINGSATNEDGNNVSLGLGPSNVVVKYKSSNVEMHNSDNLQIINSGDTDLLSTLYPVNASGTFFKVDVAGNFTCQQSGTYWIKVTVSYNNDTINGRGLLIGSSLVTNPTLSGKMKIYVDDAVTDNTERKYATLVLDSRNFTAGDIFSLSVNSSVGDTSIYTCACEFYKSELIVDY